jgi:hypothetical protein
LKAARTPSDAVVTTGLRCAVCGEVGAIAGFSVPVGCCPVGLGGVLEFVERGRAEVVDDELVFWANVS